MSSGSAIRRLTALIIGPGSSIHDAMSAIDRGGVEIALLVDADDRLLGTITDGDIRRALLAGASLTEPAIAYATKDPYVVSDGAARADVLDLMRARRLSQIPIVDVADRLVGLHVMQDLLGGQERPNWAVIMAGGRGSRLGDMTDHIPKPMLEVAGRPILERIILHLIGSGIRNVFLSVNYRSEIIEDHFGSGAALGCQIEYLKESEPLGTGGSLGLLREAGHVPAHPVLVMNGDLMTDFSVEGLLSHHAASGSLATVAVHEYSHFIPYGVVSSADDQLVAIEEKPTKRWLVNAGIYVLEPEVISRIPPSTPLAVTAIIRQAVSNGEKVAIWRSTGDWADIGRPPDLLRARGEQ